METGKIDLTQSKELLKDLMPKKFGLQGKLWVGFLLIVILVGAYCYYRQLKYGLVVTDMRDFTSWGIYISNFVFFCSNKSGRFSCKCHFKALEYSLENAPGKNFRSDCCCCHNICRNNYYS